MRQERALVGQTRYCSRVIVSMRLVSATLVSAFVLSFGAGCSHGGSEAASTHPIGSSGASTTPAATSTSAASDKLDDCVGKSDGEVVRLKVANTHLDGVLIGRGPVGVVLAHERGRNLCDW